MKASKIIFLSLFLGICLRFFLSSIAFNRGDILVHFDWSRTLYKTGIKGSYSYPNWIYSPPTQPPLMMFNFWVSRHLYENRYLLSELHNKIRLPPASFILWFDKYGESILLRLWSIVGDIFCSLFIYWIILKIKKDKKIAIIGFLLFFFNPISLFETCIWGQNDIYGSSFILISLSFLFYKKLRFLSPPIFVLGILAKPTGLIIAPFYCFYYLFSFDFGNIKKTLLNIFQMMISIVLSLLLTIYSFSPFVSNNLFKDILWIFANRISNGSKGISLASVSAFNFFSLIFKIDRTPGSIKVLGLTMDSFGMILYFLINILALYLLIKYKKNKDKFSFLMFLVYFVSNGAFLFMTSMLERYFMLALVPSVVLMICFFKKIGINMIIQQVIWFTNLIYAFYWRDYSIIKIIFLDDKFILIRLLSLISIINFLFISKTMITYIKTESIKTTVS